MHQTTATHILQETDNTGRTTVQGTVFDIKRFAVHDGPGIRTTVFLKGCPLSCLWCHNPESQARQPQLVFIAHKCIGCGQCFEVCPNGVHQLVNGDHVIDWQRCVACGTCAQECFAGALEIAGKETTVDDVMAEVVADRVFYERSGGGVTLSGGEPLAQSTFTRALLSEAKAQGLHTALDTSGFTSWERLAELLDDVDLVLYDLKHMDSERHKALTSVPNDRILDNLSRLNAADQPVWVRIPLIPGENDSDANYHALGEFLAGMHVVERIEILRYHRFAESKYEQIGHEYTLKGLEPPSEDRAASRQHILEGYGLTGIAYR